MKKNTNGNIGFGRVLFIVFLVLKLTHVIDWSWWWISAPLWIPVALIIVLYAVKVWLDRKNQSRPKQRLDEDEFSAEYERIIEELRKRG